MHTLFDTHSVCAVHTHKPGARYLLCSSHPHTPPLWPPAKHSPSEMDRIRLCDADASPLISAELLQICTEQNQAQWVSVIPARGHIQQ